MCETLRGLMKDEIDRDINKARAEGEAKIILNMEKMEYL